jgi:hypothetical protein
MGSWMISGTDPRAITPGIGEDPTNKAVLELEVCRGESRVAVGLEVPPEDGSGLVAMCTGMVSASVVAVGGPAVTLWAAHIASFGPGWAWSLAVAQLVLARELAVRSYRRGHRKSTQE